MIGGVCLIDLRVVSADLYLVVGWGHLGLSFPFNEREVEVNARARRAGEGIRMSFPFRPSGRGGFRFLFEASPRLWVASELVDGG